MRKQLDVYTISFVIMSFVFSIVFVSSILFFFNIPVGYIQFVLASGLTILLGWKICCKETDIRYYVCHLIVCGLLIWLAILYCQHVYMNVWDSNSYHKQAIGLIKNGWVPVYQSSFDFEMKANTTGFYSEDPLTWAEVYPKGTWIYGGMIYFLTRSIESAKSYTILSMIVVFGIAYDFIKRTYGTKLAGIIALLAACNPISLAQFKCFYNDGFSDNIVLIILMEFYILEHQKEDVKKHWAMIIMAIILGCNLKMSILAFVVAVCAVYSIYILVKDFVLNKDKGVRIGCVKKVAALLGAGVVGTVIVGFTPYLTNILRYGSLTYKTGDLLGNAGTRDLGIEGCGNVEAFLLSFFGKMSSLKYTTKEELVKLPFTIHEGELDAYRLADTRVSGMGIWFSGIMCIVVAILIVGFIKYKKDMFRCKIAYVYIVALMMLCIMIPLTFQHRYIGFIYYVPIVTLLVMFECYKGVYKQIGMLLLMVAMVVNCAPWISTTVDVMKSSASIEAELKGMRDESVDGEIYDVVLIHEQFTGLLYDLQDYDIEYDYTPEIEGEDVYGILGGWVRVVDETEGVAVE